MDSVYAQWAVHNFFEYLVANATTLLLVNFLQDNLEIRLLPLISQATDHVLQVFSI